MRRTAHVFVGIVLVLGLFGCAVDDTWRASQICQGSGPIARSETLEAGDAGLYLLTRGDHCDAPILIWLHGGPGAAERPLFRVFNGDLEQDFVVVYWDQRGAGRSFDPAADPSQLTVGRHLADLDLVVDHLRERFGRDRIILAGHSWGAALGLLYAQRHPDKVAMLFCVAPLVAAIDAQRAQLEFVESEARRRNDEEVWVEIAGLDRPPFSGPQMLRVQNMVDRYGGYFHDRPSFATVTLEALFSGYVRPWEIWTLIKANEVSLQAMAGELAGLDLRRLVPSLDVPLVFMLGRYDHQTDPQIAARYFAGLDAPRKSLIWFEQSAHNIPFEQPEQFAERLRSARAYLAMGHPGRLRLRPGGAG